MVYLKEFETVSAYETFAASEEFVEPNVSMIGEYGASGFGVKYNKDKPGPIPPQPSGYSQDYLTFVFSTSGSITVYLDSLYLSNDDGENWVQGSVSANSGDRILVKGDVKKSYEEICDSLFECEGNFSVEGNVMSVYDSINFRNRTSFDSNNHDLSYLFAHLTGLTSAENLVLPVTALTYKCYEYMFYECTSLTTAPELPATTLAEDCYEYMFQHCTNLNYIKCLATDISADYCTFEWVDGVSTSGTFVKNPNMSSWTTGIDGIPTNWTVQDAS